MTTDYWLDKDISVIALVRLDCELLFQRILTLSRPQYKQSPHWKTYLKFHNLFVVYGMEVEGRNKMEEDCLLSSLVEQEIRKGYLTSLWFIYHYPSSKWLTKDIEWETRKIPNTPLSLFFHPLNYQTKEMIFYSILSPLSFHRPHPPINSIFKHSVNDSNIWVCFV